MDGKIKNIVFERGFGFIYGEDRHDRFFHISGCESEDAFYKLSVGDPVTFELKDDPRGSKAVRIEAQ